MDGDITPIKRKKKVIKKKPKIKTNPKPSNKSEGTYALIIIGLLVIFLSAIAAYFMSNLPKEFKIKVGECYLDRAYKPLKVYRVWDHDKTVFFKEQIVKDATENGDYYLAGDGYSSYDRERTFNFIKNNYTKIPCNNFYKE